MLQLQGRVTEGLLRSNVSSQQPVSPAPLPAN